jgi:hypothetical protein
MKVIIDKQDDLVSIKEGELSGVITEKIEPLLYSSGKIISEINFNNEQLDIENIAGSCPQKEFNENDILNITTQPLKDHLFVVIDNIAAGISKAEEDSIEISENLLKANNQDALKSLSDWCGDIAELIQNIDTFIATFKVNINGLKINNKEFAECLKEVSSFLDEINTALENNDKTTIADLIEFEVSPIVAGIKDILPIFKTRLEEVFNKQE